MTAIKGDKGISDGDKLYKENTAGAVICEERKGGEGWWQGLILIRQSKKTFLWSRLQSWCLSDMLGPAVRRPEDRRFKAEGRANVKALRQEQA